MPIIGAVIIPGTAAIKIPVPATATGTGCCFTISAALTNVSNQQVCACQSRTWRTEYLPAEQLVLMLPSAFLRELDRSFL